MHIFGKFCSNLYYMHVSSETKEVIRWLTKHEKNKIKTSLKQNDDLFFFILVQLHRWTSDFINEENVVLIAYRSPITEKS